MPHLDGIQTIRLLRTLFARMGNCQVPPMILVTAYSHDDELPQLGEAIDGLLAKPITARHVYVELARSLGVFDPRAIDAESDLRHKLDWPAFRGIDILLVEDLAINQEVMLELLSGVGIYARVACNGEEALADGLPDAGYGWLYGNSPTSPESDVAIDSGYCPDRQRNG